MAQECGFFNAQLVDGEYDRVYLAEQFAAYFASFIGNGIFGNSMQELEVVSSNNMTTKVLSGQGWINGWWYRNTSDCTLSHSLADGILSRIDVIVLRWDNSARDMYLHVIEGVPSVNPVKPDIVRDSDYYDLQLAYVSIPKGSVRISQSQITDTRLDNSVCGLVTGVVDQIDTTGLFIQFMQAYQEWKENQQADYENWTEVQKAAYNQFIEDMEGDYNDFVEQSEQAYSDFVEQSEEDYTGYTEGKKTEFNTWYSTYLSEFQDAIEEWFEEIKGQISEDAAVRIQLELNNHENAINNINNMVYHNDFVSSIAAENYPDEDALIITNNGELLLMGWSFVEEPLDLGNINIEDIPNATFGHKGLMLPEHVVSLYNLEKYKHSHNNKYVIDKFAEDEDGKPIYNGQPIGGGIGEGFEFNETFNSWNFAKGSNINIGSQTKTLTIGNYSVYAQFILDSSVAGNDNKMRICAPYGIIFDTEYDGEIVLCNITGYIDDDGNESLKIDKGFIAEDISDGTGSLADLRTNKIDNTEDGLNGAINKLSVGTVAPQDNDYYIGQYSGGGTTHTTYHRRPMSMLWGYIKTKAESVAVGFNNLKTKTVTGNKTSGTEGTDNYVTDRLDIVGGNSAQKTGATGISIKSAGTMISDVGRFKVNSAGNVSINANESITIETAVGSNANININSNSTLHINALSKAYIQSLSEISIKAVGGDDLSDINIVADGDVKIDSTNTEIYHSSNFDIYGPKVQFSEQKNTGSPYFQCSKAVSYIKSYGVQLTSDGLLELQDKQAGNIIRKRGGGSIVDGFILGDLDNPTIFKSRYFTSFAIKKGRTFSQIYRTFATQVFGQDASAISIPANASVTCNGYIVLDNVPRAVRGICTDSSGNIYLHYFANMYSTKDDASIQTFAIPNTSVVCNVDIVIYTPRIYEVVDFFETE